MNEAKPLIALVGVGSMGASLAARMVRAGARVVSPLAARSPASRERALAAGVADVGEDEAAGAQLLLSVVPPAVAVETAQHWSAVLARHPRPAAYVDCNAVSVSTAQRIAEAIAPSRARFVDACIIGGPGKPADPGPILYLSGEVQGDVELLAGLGLRVRSTGGALGSASALKMAYAGINKGFIGLGAAMVLAAARVGAADALREELASSLPHLLDRLRSGLPDMYAKAWRWDPEMREIADFAGADPDVARLYEAMGDLFGRLGRDWDGPREAMAAIDAFLQRSPPQP